MWIPGVSFNFPIEENPKMVTITEKHLMHKQSMNLDLHKIMRVMLFSFRNCEGPCNGRTALRIIMT